MKTVLLVLVVSAAAAALTVGVMLYRDSDKQPNERQRAKDSSQVLAAYLGTGYHGLHQVAPGFWSAVFGEQGCVMIELDRFALGLERPTGIAKDESC